MSRLPTALILIAASVLWLPAARAAGEPARPSGTLIDQTPCTPNPVDTYEQYVERRTRRFADEVEAAKAEGFQIDVPNDLTAVLLSKEEFAKRRAYTGFECRRITYLSDGLKVIGYLWKPQDTTGKKLPLIIYNRGGNRDFGALSPWMQSGFFEYLANGFVVVGSQYRGNDGGEGKEEFGGAEVRDVLHLVPLAASLGYVDMANVFMLGWSRGGMMTLLALKQGMAVNAAAVGGVPADLTATKEERQAMIDNVYKELIPDFDTRSEEVMRDRSAVYWADRINVPLLILQGGADWRVQTRTNALALASKLQELRRPYELIVYAGDDHGLSVNSADSDRRIIAWFKRHLR